MPVADFRTLRREVGARGEEIDALTSICDLAKPAMDALPASMRCSWDGSLEEFGANLQGVDRKLSHLSTLASQSGIKNLLKLAHVGRLHDLCRDESLQAREVDRLNKELGLAKVCEGPDTDIDAIGQAVDFAAGVDSGVLPPSVRCWLLQDFDANSQLVHAEMSSYIDSMSELQRTLLAMTKIAKLDVVGFWGCQTIYKTRPIQVDTSQESSAMAPLITQRSQPAIGCARRSLRAMAGKSIESGQQAGLRINGMRRLDCCSFYLPPDWKRLAPEPTRQHTLQCLV